MFLCRTFRRAELLRKLPVHLLLRRLLPRLQNLDGNLLPAVVPAVEHAERAARDFVVEVELRLGDLPLGRVRGGGERGPPRAAHAPARGFACVVPVDLRQPRREDLIQVGGVVGGPALHDEDVQRVPVSRAEHVRLADVQAHVEERGADAAQHARAVAPGNRDLVHRRVRDAGAPVGVLIQRLEAEAAAEGGRAQALAPVRGGWARVHFVQGGVGDVPERGGGEADPARVAKHRPTAALRCLQQSHMRAEIFQVVNVQRVPPREAQQVRFHRGLLRDILQLGKRVLEPLEHPRRHLLLRRARQSRRHGGRGKFTPRARACAKTRRRARKPVLPLRARRSPRGVRGATARHSYPAPSSAKFGGRCRRRVAARARITGHTELAIFSPCACADDGYCIILSYTCQLTDPPSGFFQFFMTTLR